MKPGRELDKLIARDVLKLEESNGFYIELDCPHYSTDIAAAWEIVEKLKIGNRCTVADGWQSRDTLHIRFNDPGWCAGWVFPGADYMGAENWVFGETAAHAICLAALKAVGVLSTKLQKEEHIG